jgi:hypothetical protein
MTKNEETTVYLLENQDRISKELTLAMQRLIDEGEIPGAVANALCTLLCANAIRAGIMKRELIGRVTETIGYCYGPLMRE